MGTNRKNTGATFHELEGVIGAADAMADPPLAAVALTTKLTPEISS